MTCSTEDDVQNGGGAAVFCLPRSVSLSFWSVAVAVDRRIKTLFSLLFRSVSPTAQPPEDVPLFRHRRVD